MLRSVVSQYSTFRDSFVNRHLKHALLFTPTCYFYFSSRWLSLSFVNSNITPGKVSHEQDKPAKQLVIRNKIEQHDFEIKLKTILKWLSKGHEVQVVIQNITKEKIRNEILTDSLQKALEKKGSLQKPHKNDKEWKLLVHPLQSS